MLTCRHRASCLIAIALTTATGYAQPSRSGTEADALRADLAQFRSQFMGVERSYTAVARTEAESRLTALERMLDTLDRLRFELEIARIVALADNGHSNAWPNVRSARYNRVPFRLVSLGGSLYVLRARAGHTDLLGARLIAVDGRPLDTLRAIARTLMGGTTEFRDRSAPFLLESPEQMHALGVTESAGAARYRFVLAGGRTVERNIVAERANATRPAQSSLRWLHPEPAIDEGQGWQSLLPVAQAPWSLQEVSEPFRARNAPELDALVLQFRQNHNSPGQSIEVFMAGAERTLRQGNARNLVLDMRQNGGGNLQLTRAFAQRLPSLVPGRIFVLTSPWTFSAAISTVSYLEQAAPDRVTIVGEIVGDRQEFWAEGMSVTLHNTGIRIGRSLERHDYATGCRPYTDCHRPVVQHPISVPSLAPDLPAPWSIETYRAGKDPGMEAVAAALRR